jgi:hypothetical protein
MVGGVQSTTAKEHPLMRATFTAISVAALLAAGAGSAAARPIDMPLAGSAAAQQTEATPRVAVQHHDLCTDATAVPTTHPSTPARVVHVARTREAGDGIDWTDVGIGAGLAVALLLSAAGVSAVRRHPTMTPR